MPIHELKDQIARLPEQPGVYLYFNAAGDTIYVGKARALRDRVRNYLGAYGIEPQDRRAARRGRPPRGHRHRLGRRGARAREQPDQAALAEVQHPAARRQELSLPAADDQRGVPARAGRAAGRARRQLLRRPVPAGAVRAQDDGADAPAVRHPLLQRGDHRQARPPVPRVRHQALHRAVRRHASARRRSTAAPSTLRELFLEGKNDELSTTLRARMLEAADGERFEEAAQLRDAMRTVQTLHDRQQKMATAELGHRDVFGVKLGPAGVVVQVFQVRGGRVVERVELGTRGRRSSAAERGGEVLTARDPAVLRAARGAARGPRAVGARRARGARGWLSERAGRRVRIVVPQRGEKRGLVDLANRNAALGVPDAVQSGAPRRSTTRSRRCSTVLALPALPRRIECFDISTIQGSETVASMVVCEDGRMQRGEYRKFRIRGRAWPRVRQVRERRRSAESPIRPTERRLRGDARGRAAPLPQAARARRAVSRSDPDRRRQGAAVGRLRGARGARAGEPGGRRHREEGRAALHARSRRSDRARRHTIRRCC